MIISWLGSKFNISDEILKALSAESANGECFR